MKYRPVAGLSATGVELQFYDARRHQPRRRRSVRKELTGHISGSSVGCTPKRRLQTIIVVQEDYRVGPRRVESVAVSLQGTDAGGL